MLRLRRVACSALPASAGGCDQLFLPSPLSHAPHVVSANDGCGHSAMPSMERRTATMSTLPSPPSCSSSSASTRLSLLTGHASASRKSSGSEDGTSLAQALLTRCCSCTPWSHEASALRMHRARACFSLLITVLCAVTYSGAWPVASSHRLAISSSVPSLTLAYRLKGMSTYRATMAACIGTQSEVPTCTDTMRTRRELCSSATVCSSATNDETAAGRTATPLASGRLVGSDPLVRARWPAAALEISPGCTYSRSVSGGAGSTALLTCASTDSGGASSPMSGCVSLGLVATTDALGESA